MTRNRIIKKAKNIIILIFCIAPFYYLLSWRKSSAVQKGLNGQDFYTVMIFDPSITNCPPIKRFSLPMQDINDKKVDSINKLADQYIENCKKYTNN